MDAKELRVKSKAELLDLEKELRENLFHLRFQIQTDQTTNSAKLRHTKQDIARVLTVLGEMDREAVQ